MADPASRKSATLNRLRSQLRRKRESLAEQFDFKMYFAVVFKDKIQESITHTLHHSKARLGHSKNFFSLKDAHVKIKKKSALFEVAEVIPVMTNNYEDSILKGVQEEVYSLESSQQLLEKDIVQLHAPRYQCLRKDVIGCVQEIDFFLWPRNDIDRIVCLLFSRWKGEEHSDYRLIQGKFDFESHDYEKQLLRLLTRKEGTGLILSNPSQSLFLFVDKHNLQTEKGEVAVFKMSSFCLHVPQNQLTHWGSELRDDVLAPFMPD